MAEKQSNLEPDVEAQNGLDTFPVVADVDAFEATFCVTVRVADAVNADAVAVDANAAEDAIDVGGATICYSGSEQKSNQFSIKKKLVVNGVSRVVLSQEINLSLTDKTMT